ASYPMSFQPLDIAAFIGFLALVVGVSLYASRGKHDATDYFLAGRNLPWWLIGFSLIASNISTEHFVGMAGRGYDLGLAIASYEWMAAVTLVLVGLFFLPRFLQAGIYTIPEYLEFRYDVRTRTLMAAFIMAAYVFVALATVLYSGALALESIFGIDTVAGIWLIGILAGGYTIYGGLKAVVWSDLIQGVALLLGGVLVTVLGFQAIGGVGQFLEVADGKLHTVLPWNHPEMPWLAVFIGGLWIPNIFYWGLNQFITQRTLAARSLADGQRGIFLAGFIKLAIPFIIVFPGIMAAELFADQVTNPDQAYPVMMRELLPVGLTGAMFAALFGAVMSSLDSMLNSAATIFSVDLYKRHLRPEASSRRLMTVGRVTTGVLVLVGCLWAPVVARAGSVFEYIQMFWGFISPGIVAAFLFGIFVPRTPPAAAFGGMILGIPVYWLLLWLLPEIAFLHHMAITFLVISAFMGTLTLRQGLDEPRRLPRAVDGVDLTPAPGAKWWAGGVIGGAAVLYVVFW
ncbi:MAG: solute:sodium symporter family transporter, partial [Gemmatimonadetes bacterium]|nr:solute:sodium symporter family transporter [Gemmatimonadota bacterium]